MALFLQLRLARATLESVTNAAAVAPTEILDFKEVVPHSDGGDLTSKNETDHFGQFVSLSFAGQYYCVVCAKAQNTTRTIFYLCFWHSTGGVSIWDLRTI